MGLCSGGGQFADSEKWTPACAGPILGRWIHFVRLKCRDRAAEGNAVCSVCDRNRTGPSCKLYSQPDVERWIKTSRIIPGLTLFKTINLLDFWFKSTGFLSYAYITVKYIKARLWIVVKSAIITLWHWRFIERSYSLILSRSGPQLFFCLLCRCQGYFIFCYTFVSLRRRFNSNQRKKGEASTVAPLIKTSLPITRNFGRPILSNHLRQD